MKNFFWLFLFIINLNPAFSTDSKKVVPVINEQDLSSDEKEAMAKLIGHYVELIKLRDEKNELLNYYSHIYDKIDLLSNPTKEYYHKVHEFTDNEIKAILEGISDDVLFYLLSLGDDIYKRDYLDQEIKKLFDNNKVKELTKEKLIEYLKAKHLDNLVYYRLCEILQDENLSQKLPSGTLSNIIKTNKGCDFDKLAKDDLLIIMEHLSNRFLTYILASEFLKKREEIIGLIIRNNWRGHYIYLLIDIVAGRNEYKLSQENINVLKENIKNLSVNMGNSDSLKNNIENQNAIDNYIDNKKKEIKDIKDKYPKLKVIDQSSRVVKRYYRVLTSIPLLITFPKGDLKKEGVIPPYLRFRLILMPSNPYPCSSLAKSMGGIVSSLNLNPSIDLYNKTYSKEAKNQTYDKNIIKTLWNNKEIDKNQLLSYGIFSYPYSKKQHQDVSFILVMSFGDNEGNKGMRYCNLGKYSKDAFKDKKLGLKIEKIEWNEITDQDITAYVPNIDLNIKFIDSDESIKKTIKFIECPVLKEARTKETFGYVNNNKDAPAGAFNFLDESHAQNEDDEKEREKLLEKLGPVGGFPYSSDIIPNNNVTAYGTL